MVVLGVYVSHSLQRGRVAALRRLEGDLDAVAGAHSRQKRWAGNEAVSRRGMPADAQPWAQRGDRADPGPAAGSPACAGNRHQQQERDRRRANREHEADRRRALAEALPGVPNESRRRSPRDTRRRGRRPPGLSHGRTAATSHATSHDPHSVGRLRARSRGRFSSSVGEQRCPSR
jgi:hypothetical protein